MSQGVTFSVTATFNPNPPAGSLPAGEPPPAAPTNVNVALLTPVGTIQVALPPGVPTDWPLTSVWPQTVGVDGTTALDELDGGPVPAELVAVTVKV